MYFYLALSYLYKCVLFLYNPYLQNLLPILQMPARSNAQLYCNFGANWNAYGQNIRQMNQIAEICFLKCQCHRLKSVCCFAQAISGHTVIWAISWQNQQSDCAPSEDSDQPGHPPSLIWVFTVRTRKPWVLSYPLSAQRRLIWLGGCPGWAESSLGARSFCCFCHVVAPILQCYAM